MTNQRIGQGDQIIYYRRPRKGENAGWITYGDSLSGSKYRDFVRRGFEPLEKYGYINTYARDRAAFGDGKTAPAEAGWTTERYIWEQILSHPDGPAEFPVEQLLTFRWYRPENVPVPGVSFPQLKGVKVKEFRCPERCGRAPFVDVDGAGGARALANHLRITHGWDIPSLMAYGERIGVDFTAADVVEMTVQEYTPPEPRRRRAEEPIVEVETV